MIFECAGLAFNLDERTHIMGIINCTPDSFYAGSRNVDVMHAIESGVNMVKDGADFLDVGGESSRPGSESIPEDEEINRISSVIKELLRSVDVPISVDTYKSAVARHALDLGAHMVNDISGLGFDSSLGSIVKEYSVPVILMHIKGRPKEMQSNPHYDDVIKEIYEYLNERMNLAMRLGIPKDRIVLDPGIGFGKRLNDNYEIIRHLDEFQKLGCPLLLGASRKSFIGRVLNLPPEECLEGTLAANTAAILKGAHILRVHDVKETKRIAQIVDYLVRNTS